MWGRILLVSFGGFFGAASRFLISVYTRKLTQSSFPYGTLIVNVLGSFLLAFLAISVFKQGLLPEKYRFLLLTGFLGSFTTFSTFSYQSLTLLRAGKHQLFTLNVAGNVILCLIGAWIGLVMGNSIRF